MHVQPAPTTSSAGSPTPSTKPPRTRSRIRPLRAIGALAALLRDPEDTQQVFTIIDALSGPSDDRMRQRLTEDPVGAVLLERRADILPMLQDRAALEALPDDSLGRAYLRFMESEAITADGLVDAAETGGDASLDLTDEQQWVKQRMRDTHDLWHTVLGYRGDIIGEASVLAFLLAQSWNAGVGLIVLGALQKLPTSADRRIVADAFRRGMVARWLPATDWESLLAQPITEVRRQLRLDDPPHYAPLRPQDV